MGHSRIAEAMESLCAGYGIKPVAVVSSTRITSPLVAGFWKPTIYLPANPDFGQAEVETMLSHELAHVRQRDNVWAVLSQVFVALLWPNPFAWIAWRQMSAASEELCDLAVLRTGIKPANYAECLLRIAERSSGFASQGVAVGMFSSKAQLSKRVALLFDAVRMRQAGLRRRNRWQLAFAVSGVALATCFIIPAQAVYSHDATRKSLSAGSFPVSKAELDLANHSGMPYIKGDFTLVYRMVSRDTRTDAERREAFDKGKAIMKSQFDRAVKAGKMNQSDEEDQLSRVMFEAHDVPQEREITLASKNGLLFFSDSGGSSSLTTRDHVFMAWKANETTTAVDVREVFSPINALWNLHLPAVGFAHMPLSLKPVAANASTTTIPDLPQLNGMVAQRPWDGNLKIDMARSPCVAVFGGTGENRRILSISQANGKPEYVFRSFIALKGTQVASDYTFFSSTSRYDYTLESAEPAASPKLPFDPGQFISGKELRINYEGRNLEFIGDPRGTDFDAQLKEQAAKWDTAQPGIKAASAHEEYVENLPGGAPDILPLYAAAIAKAKENGRHVLAITTATNCMPCHQLAKMFNDPSIKPIMEKHFEILWIDAGEDVTRKQYENLNGWKLIKQLDLNTGFPSYAAIDGDGKVVEKAGGIGYPSEPQSDSRFFRVLNAGGTPLSDQEQKTMQGYLNSHRG
jgi:hypothetical protein